MKDLIFKNRSQQDSKVGTLNPGRRKENPSSQLEDNRRETLAQNQLRTLIQSRTQPYQLLSRPVSKLAVGLKGQPLLQNTIQRTIISGQITSSENENLITAYQLFIQTISAGNGASKLYYDFAASGSNDHDLIFEVIHAPTRGEKKGQVLGQTFFEYRDKAEDILSHLSKENLLDQSLGIDFDRLTQHGMNTKIIINTGNCDPSVEGMLQTLLHEYGVHAMEWVDFIQNILPQKQKTNVQDYLSTHFSKTGILSAGTQHEKFGKRQSLHYNALRDKALETIPKKYHSEFIRHSEEDRKAHNPEELQREMQDIIKKAEALETMDFSFNPKNRRRRELTEPLLTQSPKKEKGWCGCPWCFITTACMRAKALPDDCHELETLRQFRDGYMLSPKVPEGPALIDEYYRIAPGIVASICEQPDHPRIFSGLYQTIAEAVQCIDARKNSQALKIYKTMVLDLKDRYTKEPG